MLERLHQAQNVMYAGGELEPVRSLLTPDVEWHVPGENAIAGTYRGIEEVVGYFIRRREVAGRSLRLHPGDVLAGEGDHIASLTDGSAVIGGREHRWSTVGLYRIDSERIAACWLLPLDPVAFDLAWSPDAFAGDILILTGPPGSGKTTTGRALAALYERSVHLEADLFFHFIRAGYIPPWRPDSHEQNTFVIGLVADAAAGFAGQGYRTILEGIFSPGWFLTPVMDRLESLGHRVTCAVLRAPLDVCRGRLAGRPSPQDVDPDVIDQLSAQFADFGDLEVVAIDTTDTAPEAAARAISERW